MAETLHLIPQSDFERLLTSLRQEVRDLALVKKEEKPLTKKEAADHLRIGRTALDNRINNGSIPSKYVHKNGGTVYFYASELNELLKKS
jgi:hypothetical protein